MAVIGPVGAGKSSLISSLLGEMRRLEGHVAMKVGKQETKTSPESRLYNEVSLYEIQKTSKPHKHVSSKNI